MEYKRLGEYIEPVDERNSKLEIKLSQGICNEKYFQDPRQVAENSAADKIVRRGYFAYNRATTRNGEKISIAYREGPDCTVSSAYQVFRIKDEEKLNPKYLLMWYKRPDFDKYARFRSHGSAHEFFEYEEMCDVRIPLPSIERQREIVEEYETLTNRIRLNNQMIQYLEATAQALYRKTFVDNLDKENLPEGWRTGTIGEILEKFIRGPFGSALKKEDMQAGGIPVYEQQHVIDEHIRFRYYISEAKYESLKRFTVKKNDLVISCSGTIGKIKQISDNDPAGIINQALLILRVNIHKYSPILLRYFLLSGEGHNMLLEDAHGSAQINIAKKEVIESIPILIPKSKILNEIDGQLKIIDCRICLYKQENSKLTELQSLLLAKMGQ